MLRRLLNLKKLGATGIKLEFESEYFSENFAFDFAQLVHRIGLDLCVKLGGASSIKDLHISRRLCANLIVAPMIESTYGVEKFLDCVQQVYGKGYPELFINIETKTAFENLDKIIEKCDSRISGFVVGRTDLKKSLGLEDFNDASILELCNRLSKKCKEQDKKLILGGKINLKSINFINNVENLTMVETRKVIFEKEHFNEENLKAALEFELHYLKRKNSGYKEDLTRIEFIEKALSADALV